MRKTERKNHLEDLDIEWENYIQMDIQETGSIVALFDLVQNGDKWRAELNGNQSSGSINEGNFLTSWVTIKKHSAPWSYQSLCNWG